MGAKVRASISGSIVRVLVACVVVGASTSACATSSSGGGSGSTASPTATQTARRDCLVGAAWFNAADGDVLQFASPALQQAIPPIFGSVSYRDRDARSMSETQSQDIDELVRNGATVLIITPSYDGGELPAVERAVKAGVPVIVLGRPIAARSLFIGFDDVEAGRQEAKALLAVKPKGTYAIIAGSVPGSNTDPVAAGIKEILQPAVDRGDITMATVEWRWDRSPAENLTAMLNQTGGSVDAVAAESDGLAAEVQAALGDAGSAGKVAVGGVDGNGTLDGFLGVARGTQAVDVWENGELIARAATQAAIALCRNPDIAKVDGSASATWPGHDPMTAILLKPVTITKDTLHVVIETDMYWRQLICGDSLGLDRPELPACQLGPVPAASPSA